MANHSYVGLPPGWGAISTLRPSRRRSRQVPVLVVLVGLALALMLVAGFLTRT